MDQVELKTTGREELGKEASKRYRNEGLIPAVVYAKGNDNKNLLVKESDLIKSLNTDSKRHAIFNLEIDSKKTTAMIQDIDVHPVKGLIRHVDFKYINMKEEIEIEIDVKLQGVAKGAKMGGVFRHQLKKVVVKCLPANLPNHLNVDVSDIDMGEKLRVKDIQLDNVSIIYPNGEKIIAKVDKPRGKQA